MSALSTSADPIYALPRAERPAYATGMLLDAQDFSDEQTYHRGRLARAMVFLAGGGTLAGLRVEYVAATSKTPEEIRVQPGLAVDRLGRLIEVPRPACLRLQPWFDQLFATDAGDSVERASYDDLARFVSQRAVDDAVVLPARALVVDVFLRFVACAVGLTPSFAEGPFDALNAVSTSRVRDAYELQAVARFALDDVYNGLPLPVIDPGVDLGDAVARRSALQDQVLDAYAASCHVDGIKGLTHSAEQPPEVDASSIFLARVFVPVDGANPPARIGDAVIVDNHARRFLPSGALLADLSGF